MKSGPKSLLVRFTALCCLLALVGACSREKPGEPAGPPGLTLPPVQLELFAPLPAPPPPAVTPSLRDLATPVDQASNYKPVMEFLGIRLSEAQKKFLSQHRFLLIPKSGTRFQGQLLLEWDEMLGLFDVVCGSYSLYDRKPENSHLVTPDAVLHAFHKYFENSLEELETTELSSRLRRFLQGAQAQALDYRAQSSGQLAARYELIAAQLTVPLIILENARWSRPEQPESRLPEGAAEATPDDQDSLENALKLLEKFQGQFSPDLYGKMQAEIRSIYAAQEVTVSPLYGQYSQAEMLKTDYTQFTPRSHYQKSSLLRAYFRAMMYLGRNGYQLAQPAGLTDALLVAHLLASPGPGGQPPLLKDWQRIMEITAFYAGIPDDLTYPEWRDFVVRTLRTEQFSPAQAIDPEFLRKLSPHMSELKPPRILSDILIGEGVFSLNKEGLLATTKALRLFGQRFTLDGWILNRLTAGQEQTETRLPSTPSALFVPAVLGDAAARGFIRPFLEKGSPPFSRDEVQGFYGKLDKVAAEIAKVSDAEWYGSLSGAWLKLLGTLTASSGGGYPLYMRDQLFPIKQLQTFLGSYTELKHDTLLYAKQSYAEMGDGGEEGKPPPVPKGFVEPNLAFWQTLQNLVNFTAAGFNKYGLFPGEKEEFGKLNLFKSQVDFYTNLARKELQGEPLTEDEYERLRTENLSYMAQPFDPNVILEEKDRRSGLIADLHTDAVQQRVLYEATGEPYLMLALVGNESSPRLTIGVAFNHYEFTGPLTTRYTDTDWQRLVYENPGRLPAKNFWYDRLLIK